MQTACVPVKGLWKRPAWRALRHGGVVVGGSPVSNIPATEWFISGNLQYVLQFLHSNYCHYLNHIVIYLVIYGVRATRTSSISFLYIVHRLKCKWSAGNHVETIKKSIKVFVCLSQSKLLNAKVVNANQILLSCIA